MNSDTPQILQKKPGEPGGEKARAMAMEAAQQIGKLLDTAAPIWAGDVADIIRPLVAGALAACALAEAQKIRRHLGQFYYVTKDSSSRAKTFEAWLDEHVAALERAAEGE